MFPCDMRNNRLTVYVCVCVFPYFSPGGGVSDVTRRDGPEVCVVISGQRQGQVYLCDTADLESSAHSRHPVSEGCPGNFQAKLENQVHVRYVSNNITIM